MSQSYRICTRTIMDTSDPNITFDERGESDYCANFDTQIKPNWHTDARGEAELMRTARRSRRKAKARTLTASSV